MKIISFVFARGNSKGIKNKNLLKFRKTTLLGNSISQAMKSKFINDVFVSTDSSQIASEAKRNKAKVPFMRPKKLASDTSPIIYSWRHAVKYLNNKLNLKPDYIVDVPPTAPLRKVSDIDSCIKLAISKNLDIVYTVTPSSRSPYFNMLVKKNGKLQLVIKTKKKFFNRQETPKTYDMTTVCYVFKPKYINKTKNIHSGKTGFVIVPKERAIDIDDNLDYKFAKYLSNEKK